MPWLIAGVSDHRRSIADRMVLAENFEDLAEEQLNAWMGVELQKRLDPARHGLDLPEDGGGVTDHGAVGHNVHAGVAAGVAAKHEPQQRRHLRVDLRHPCPHRRDWAAAAIPVRFGHPARSAIRSSLLGTAVANRKDKTTTGAGMNGMVCRRTLRR